VPQQAAYWLSVALPPTHDRHPPFQKINRLPTKVHSHAFWWCLQIRIFHVHARHWVSLLQLAKLYSPYALFQPLLQVHKPSYWLTAALAKRQVPVFRVRLPLSLSPVSKKHFALSTYLYAFLTHKQKSLKLSLRYATRDTLLKQHHFSK
jgi:hypothetical protein